MRGSPPSQRASPRTDEPAASPACAARRPPTSRAPSSPTSTRYYHLLDPEARERTGDWEQVACETVAMLRLEAGRYPGDRRLADLIGELTLNSPEFSTWWNDHRVLRHTHWSAHYWHRLVGDLHFSYEFMQLPGDDNQTLCVYLSRIPGHLQQLERLHDRHRTGPPPDRPRELSSPGSSGGSAGGPVPQTACREPPFGAAGSRACPL
ncbi:hypothetical protein ABT275_45570 [Streptomyces sp. NPDC001185]|uniref:MmyB family transcriptional regulator n=1 Tax=Streptomyces sp. NPDC001185 TaxID=3154380 RepID=UPI003319DB71